MDTDFDDATALAAFVALGQPVRLAVFRLLMAAGPAGVRAGEIATRLDVRQNTLSANLSILMSAGLICSSREGRGIRYFADLAGVRGILGFIMQDCCGGRPEVCQPAIAEAAGAA